MPLVFYGDGPSKSLRPIVLKPHFPKPSTNASPSIHVANVVSPLPSSKTTYVGGPFDVSNFFSYLLMHHFLLGCFFMQPFCFHHLGNPI
jgi:hypothetical protein